MNSTILYHIALVTHICGITLLAGITIAQWVAMNNVFRRSTDDFSGAAALRKLATRFAMFSGIGFLLLILSGVTMMWITGGVFGEQTWFRVKIILIILIIINAIAVGRRLNKRFAEQLGKPIDIKQLKKIKASTNLFCSIQSAMFLVIYILSVFKFN